jgi:hypothetical protein
MPAQFEIEAKIRQIVEDHTDRSGSATGSGWQHIPEG